MQLVDQKKRSYQEELAARDLRGAGRFAVQNFWPTFLGSVCAGVAAVMTAMKTGNVLLWPCAVLIVGIGTVRAFQMRKYERRTAMLTSEQAEQWEPRYAIGAMAYAAALGLWCFVTMLRQRRRGRASAVRHGDGRLYRRRRRRALTAAPRLIQYQSCSPAARCRWRWCCMAASSTWGWRRCWCCSSSALKHINLNLHSIFVER